MPANCPRPKTIRRNPSLKIMNSQCSCTECDSISCFAKRHSKQPCTCDKCKNPKTCLFYTNDTVNLDENQSYTNIGDKGNQGDDTKEKVKERFKKEIIYKYDKNTNTQTVTKKQSKYSYKTNGPKVLEYAKTEKVNERSPTEIHSVAITYSRKEFNPSTGKLSAQVMDVPYKEFKEPVSHNRSDTPRHGTTKLSKYEIFKRIKEVYKACSCKVCECIVGKPFENKNELCKCKPCDCKDCMSFMTNFEDTDFRTFLARDGYPCIKYNRSQHNDALNKFDGSKSCDCKPCDSIECTDRLSKPCNCEPCQCIECDSMAIHKRRTLIVAPVAEDYHRNVCQCSPCDCIECPRGCGMSLSLGHEMSTSTDRYPHCHCETCLNEACDPGVNDSCKCERRNRVMTKPVQKDTHDYDIRTLLANDSHSSQEHRTKSETHDTITMFTTLSNTYPKFTSNKTLCSCNECECLVSNCKDNAVNGIKSSQLFTESGKRPVLAKNIFNTCKCSPCECQVCSKKEDDRQLQGKNSVTKNCNCDVCYCMNCVSMGTHINKCNAISKQNSMHSSKRVCKCNLCECIDYKSKMVTCSGEICRCRKCRCEKCFDCHEVFYPNKKGELLTPSIYKAKVDKSFNTSHYKRGISMHNNDLDSAFAQSKASFKALNDKTRSQKGISLYKVHLHNDYLKIKPKQRLNSLAELASDKKPQISENDHLNMKDIKENCNILKRDAYIQCHERNSSKYAYKNETVDYKESDTCFSGNSSFASTSKLSYYKESGNISPTNTPKNKSCESSCNSSGRHSPEYLIRFPKTTVEACINDVMKFNLENTFKCDRPNFGSKRNCYQDNSINTRHETDVTLHDRKCSQGYNERPKINLQLPKTNWNINIENKNGDSSDPHFEKRNNYNHYVKRRCKSACCYETDHNKHLRRKDLSTQTLDGNEKSLKCTKCFGQNTNQKCYIFTNNLKELGSSKDLFKHRHYNLSSKQFTDGIRNEGYRTWKYDTRSPCSYIKNDVDLLHTDADYERVQKTLREARAYSLDLMKILEKYEKANREFESISGKLRFSHESLLSGTMQGSLKKPKVEIVDCRNENLVERDTEYGLQKGLQDDKSLRTIQKQDTSDLEIVKQQLEPGKMDDNEVINVLTASSEQLNGFIFDVKRELDNLQSGISKDNEERGQTNEIKSTIIKQNHKTIRNTVKDLQSDTNLGFENDAMKSTVREKYYETIQNAVNELQKGLEETEYTDKIQRTIKEPDCDTIRNDTNMSVNRPNEIAQSSKSGQRCSKTHCKKYKKLLKRTIIISKKINVAHRSRQVTNKCVATESSNNIAVNIYKNDLNVPSTSRDTLPKSFLEIEDTKKHAKHDLVQIMRKLDTVFGLTEGMPETVSAGKLEKRRHENKEISTLEKIAQIQKTKQIEQQIPWPIMLKNIILDSKPTMRHKGVCVFPLIENEIKEAVQTISLQTNTAVKNGDIVSNRENKALAKLQVEVKNLLNMPLLQASSTMPAMEHVERNSNSQPTSSKSSCDALKVSFIALRRVSDHTVLVKWNVPRVLTEVQGYELLVDGRAVQKIFSPSRCMAVVTCLPHCDKLLVTVRTIMSTNTETGHHPSSTVVYRPRVK